MNLILFSAEESRAPLPRHDLRAVHLRKILRKNAGDEFEAGILGGMTGTGVITRIEDGAVFFKLNLDMPAPPRLPLRIAVGFPRPIQLRRILRDLSSMGVSGIDLIETELGEKSYRETTLLSTGGAQAALVEGAAQSRDTTLPVLRLFPGVGAWCSALPLDGKQRVAADNVRPAGIGLADCGAQGFVIAVGSERGWSEQERAALEAAGFQRRSLGARALRTETAAVAAAALAITMLQRPPVST
jgi:RsmE family RNA methyltransferase